MTKCIRCNKNNVTIHTCSPSKEYRAGIIEGLKIASDEVKEIINLSANHRIESLMKVILIHSKKEF